MNDPIVLSIDFDGTIVEVDYPRIGKLIPGAIRYINKLHKEGYMIIINSCRAGKHERQMRSFLNIQGIKYHYINENAEFLIEKYKTDTRKISANIYIDDKSLGGLPPWKVIYETIKNGNHATT